MITESNLQGTFQGETINKLPEGSRAEVIRSGIEARLAEVSSAIKDGHSSPVRLELVSVGQRILALFDEIVTEIPKDWEKKPEKIEHEVSAEEFEQGEVIIGNNRSERFWEIDSEIGVLAKKFDELYEEQMVTGPDNFFIRQEKPLIH